LMKPPTPTGKGTFLRRSSIRERPSNSTPDNKTALNFIARTIHAQYKPGVQAQENVAKATEAIQAYQRILEKDPKTTKPTKPLPTSTKR
jgi:hypothetical protein